MKKLFDSIKSAFLGKTQKKEPDNFNIPLPLTSKENTSHLESPHSSVPKCSDGNLLFNNSQIKKNDTSSHNTYIFDADLDNTYILNADLIDTCSKKFVAIDVETTGLRPYSDKIIQLSAVTFIDNKPASFFDTYINPNTHIPLVATEVNHITDEMVKDAPTEREALDMFSKYVGADALSGKTIFVAHNAVFDVKFLLYAFNRNEIPVSIKFFDTLFASRNMLPNHLGKTLGNVAAYFNIDHGDLHNSIVDAQLCGEIFVKFMELRKEELLKRYSSMSDFEISICRWFRSMLIKNDCDTQLLSFNSTSSYLTVFCYTAVVKFKTKARKPYVIVSSRRPLPENLDFSPATKSEGEGFLRYYFSVTDDLDPLSDYFVGRYNRVLLSAKEILGKSESAMKAAAKDINSRITI